MSSGKKKQPPQPLSNTASGLWFHTPVGRLQRYGPAPGGAFWYYAKAVDGLWHAYRDEDVTPEKGAKE